MIIHVWSCMYIPGEHKHSLMIWHWHWLCLVHTQHILSTLRTYWAPGKGCNSFAVTLIVTNHCEHVAICKMSPSACKNASSANVKGIHIQPFSGNLPSAIQQSASREMASTPTNPNRIPQIRMLSWRLHDFAIFATKRWIAAVCQGASRPCYSQWR